MKPVEAVELVGPGDPVVRDVPLPAAEMGDALRLGEPFDGADALAEDRAEEEEAHDHGRQQALDDLHELSGRVLAQRQRAVNRACNGDRGHEKASGHGARLAETQRCPNEEREDHVRVAPAPGEEDRRADPSDCRQDDHGLEPLRRSRELAPGPGRRDQEERRDDERAHAVADPPEQPARACVVQLAAQREDTDAVRRREHLACQRPQDGEREDIPHPVERRPNVGPQQKRRSDHCLERVADRDARRLADRGAAGRVCDEGSNGHRGPEVPPEEQQPGEGDPGRGPHGRDDALRDRELDAELRGGYVGARQPRGGDGIAHGSAHAKPF